MGTKPDIALEMLSPEKAVEMWPQLGPLYDASCKSNEIAESEFSSADICVLAATGMCAVFVCYESDQPACTFAIQFNETNGKKCADIIGMAGRNLMQFKTVYWSLILDWLRANGIRYLDAYATERLARIYKAKFGFTKSCSYVRMDLQESS